MKIIRGTTPTIRFTFKTIQVGNISAAYLVVKNNCSVILKKSDGIPDAENNTLSFTLTQAESLALPRSDDLNIMLDWLTVDGTRGRSRVEDLRTADSGLNEVI